MNNYSPLHVHTHYSPMDGVATPEEYINRAVEVGMTSCAITDHGTLSGHRDFYRVAKAAGIKPILGVEAYFTKDRFDNRDNKDREGPLDVNYNHLIVIAKNDKGLANLNKISEISWTEGFHRKPRFDFEILDKYGDDLIITSGCMSGLLNKAIENEEFAVAKQHLKWFGERFGDDFYVEVMPHNQPGINKALVELADEGGYQLVVTPDCHHATLDQKVIQEVMLLNNTHAKLDKDVTYAKSEKFENVMDRLDYLYGEDRMMSFNKFDIHLLSYDEMVVGMGDDWREDMAENSLKAAEKVEDYTIKSNLNLLPKTHRDPDKEISEAAYAFLEEKGLDNPEYMVRMEEELSVIKDKKFAPYFIVVRNMIQWAKKNNIVVGPGRGSSAGSLLCYALGITEVDPIVHGLLFFRFIDIERDDWPDIDTDIMDSRREEVKQYLEDQYRHVASIATMLTFKDKGVVRDVARALHVPLSDVNRVLKKVDTWDEFCTSRDSAEFRDKYPDIIPIGEKLRGRIRGTGIHAAGVVTSSKPISQVAPIETRVDPASKQRIPVIAVDMDEAADIGLIKIDALGLKTLSVIKDVLDIIEERTGNRPDLTNMPLDDKKVYAMLAEGRTKGVFQCETSPFTNLLIKMQVANFEELTASNALIRPGAMKSIGKVYLDRKSGKKAVEYISPLMKDFTSDTYGLIVYQEQVMQACVVLGGMSMGKANKVRKVIGKKQDAAGLDKYKKEFVDGATKHIGVTYAKEMWSDFEKHAGYSFNKSHAVAYSMLSYRTAWLKAHYPLEFMYSVLKNEANNDQRTEYLLECRRMGIPLKLPHINDSELGFSIEGKGIRFGLDSIKYVSELIGGRYLKHRPFKSYKEVEELTYTKGAGLNSRALKAMDNIGALTFDDNPVDEERIRTNLYEYLNLPEIAADIPQHMIAFSDDVDDFDENGVFIFIAFVKSITRGKGWSRVDLMDNSGTNSMFDDEHTEIEKGKSYLILVGNNRIMEYVPIDEIGSSTSAFVRFLNLKKIPMNDDQFFILKWKARKTKAGKNMATLTVANSSRELRSMVVWPDTFAQAYTRLEEGKGFDLEIGKNKTGDLVLKDVPLPKKEMV